ncbi:hypothetical protein O6H91_13G019400 [Diphasiastrum complanatum]|uniref:Uncharacterized protein n=1 Tax=Diphasiastrum complanatum TaxID=34168 RepID=A0ACC2BSL1_DIPCM|nr:hypothetical protein O6H91_13G019400 [Diphasiastrum complanatum]
MKMGMESINFRKLGPVGILKQAVSLLKQKPKLFLQVTVCFIYPFAAITQFLSYGYIAWMNRLIASWGVTQQLQIHDQLSKNLITLLDLARLLEGYLLLLIVVTALALVTMVVVICAAAETLKGQTVTLRSVMAFLPAGLKRMFLTDVVSLIFVLGMTVGYALVVCPSIICISALVPQSVLILLIVVTYVIFVIGLVYLQVVWSLWPAIAVVDEIWGTECLCKSVSLVKGKRWTSFSLMAIYMIFGGPAGYLTVKLMHGSYASIIAAGLMMSAMSTVLALFLCLTRTVLYFVCISHHEHSTSFGSQINGYPAGYKHPQEYSEIEKKPINEKSVLI